jgi:hypothetical protein
MPTTRRLRRSRRATRWSMADLEKAHELLTLIPLADWHVGMFAWHRESSENWDLKIAERTIGEAVEKPHRADAAERPRHRARRRRPHP